ncbi:hypothetical protein [Micromonospora psammae]|uniref:hypothetical protein n=1 Tax=Micromonospora sp. CPCC 205556 TaxID=3122398 RepID=UPI002FF17755
MPTGNAQLTPRALTGHRAGFEVFARVPFAGESYVQKAGFPTRDGARPAYRVLFIKSLDQTGDTVADAAMGRTLYWAFVVARDRFLGWPARQGRSY